MTINNLLVKYKIACGFLALLPSEKALFIRYHSFVTTISCIICVLKEVCMMAPDMQTLLYVAEWTLNNKRHIMSKIRQLAGTEENYLIIAQELERVNAHVYHARSLRIEATLTLVDWLLILDAYQWKCAYCQVKPFEVMSHLIPIPSSGTTPVNCIPACYSCRARRRKPFHSTATE